MDFLAQSGNFPVVILMSCRVARRRIVLMSR
nr:MAG TPA: hypothetical protein [Caudoviricetes sp.]DAK23456.1 MAG TPA: hypothetical protein [Caudoviricetes sp.]